MAIDDHIRAREAICTAAMSTRRPGSARIEFSRGAQDLASEPDPPALRSVGVKQFAMSRVSSWLVRNSAQARSAEGAIDLQERRYMIDFGAYAVVQMNGLEWGGRSGRALSTLTGAREPGESFPFWLLELLVVLRTATEAEPQDVRGQRCRHFLASVEAGHVWTVLPDRWLEDRRDLPIEVWIDDRHVRRVQIYLQQRTQTVELWDIGMDLDGLDWTRLPTFRSPG